MIWVDRVFVEIPYHFMLNRLLIPSDLLVITCLIAVMLVSLWICFTACEHLTFMVYCLLDHLAGLIDPLHSYLVLFPTY